MISYVRSVVAIMCLPWVRATIRNVLQMIFLGCSLGHHHCKDKKHHCKDMVQLGIIIPNN